MTAVPQRGAALAIASLRHGIDRIDDALLHLVAARRRLVSWLSPLKQAVGAPARNLAREQQILARARRRARRLGLSESTVTDLLSVLIADACMQQDLARHLSRTHTMETFMPGAEPAFASSDHPLRQRLLRFVPPPRRIAPLVRVLPRGLQARAIEGVLQRVLAALLRTEACSFLQGRRLGIEVSDLQASWTFTLENACLRVSHAAPEATVRGSATDLLLLASRLEDADTLFFQRRLVLTGDTELGLTARNVLDRLSWDAVPLAARIVLNRAARLARSARAASR